MRTGSEHNSIKNSRLTTAIVERSQGLARQVSRAVHQVRCCHLDDAFLATERGMNYRDELRDRD